MWFSVSTGSGCPITCPGCDVQSCGSQPTPTPPTDPEGRPIFDRRSSAYFLIVVEARKSSVTGSPALDQTLLPADPEIPPGLQILTNKRLGPLEPPPEYVDCRSGSGIEDWGGIPANPALEYDGSQSITDALSDFACRFEIHKDPSAACTADNLGNYRFMNPGGATNGAVQYCYYVNSKGAFPAGENTVLKARAVDMSGNAGPSSEIVIRVAP